MLQVYVPNISPIFIRMLQVFYLDVVICCGSYTHMLQTYVSIVSPGFNMLQQVLFPTRSDSRARTHPMLPISVMRANATYLYHVGQLQ